MTRLLPGLAHATWAAALLLLLPGTAQAHAYLVRTDPADGSRFDKAPGQVRLWFSENVSAKLTRIKLTGARTGSVPGASVAGDGTGLVVSLPRLPRDTYSLYWLTVSADDLHITRGTVAFSVDTPPPAPGARVANPAQSPAAAGTDSREVALRWLDFAAIAGLIGALSLLVICIPPAARRAASGLEQASRRLARLAAACGVVALCAGAGLLVVQAHGLSTLDSVLTGTSFGAAWIAQELLVGVLLGVALVVGRRRTGRAASVVAALAALGLCVALALNSHSAAARGHVSLATGVLAVHLLAAAVWAGGVCALALVLIGGWRARHGSAAGLLLRRFGGVAVLGMATVAITGLYSAGVDVDTPGALVTTFYGRTLLMKTGLFLAVGAVGLANSTLVRTKRHGGRWLGGWVRLEATLLGGVLLLAALLTASAPAQPERLAAPDPSAAPVSAADALSSAQVGDLLVSLSVKPNRPGVNFVTAGVFDTRRPAPAPIRAVELSIGRGGWLAARSVRRGYWQVSGNQLGRAGPWSIGVRVQRAGMPDKIAKVPWVLPRLRPQVPVERTVLSKRPLAPLLSSVAVIAALVLAAGLLGLAARRRLRPDSATDAGSSYQPHESKT